MQLRFTRDERQLLADILEELDFKLRSASPNPAGSDPSTADRRLPTVEDLLDQVIDGKFEFGCDELDKLVEILSEENRRLGDDLRNSGNGANELLQQRRRVLRSILDKVIEACAMA
ncbi:MAG TPA: hypothetical protein VEG30_09855 [Terriglobales bacterium]|nr:hypothetical protein [Terriglobales bacterium]